MSLSCMHCKNYVSSSVFCLYVKLNLEKCNKHWQIFVHVLIMNLINFDSFYRKQNFLGHFAFQGSKEVLWFLKHRTDGSCAAENLHLHKYKGTTGFLLCCVWS